MDLQTERAGPRGDAETGSRNAAKLGGLQILNTADHESNQEKTASVGPSTEAVNEVDEFLLDAIYHALSLIASSTTRAPLAGLIASNGGDPFPQLEVVGDAR